MNRWSRATLLLAVAPLFVAAGCDTPANQADKRAKADVSKAQDALRTSGSLDEPIQLLTSAAGAVEATPATRLRASSLLGQLLSRQARDAVWQVDRLDRDAQRLAMEIGQLSGQVQLASQLATGYKLFDPTPVVNNLSKQADDARGGADRPVWFETGNVRFSTLSTIATEISQIEGKIAEKSQQIQSLQSQRDAAIVATEAAAKEAETSTDRASVEAFIRSSNARKQASDLGTQLEGAVAELDMLQRERAILDARKGYVTNAAGQMEAGGNALQSGWAAMQKAVASQGELARSIATGTGGSVAVQVPEGVTIAFESMPAGSIAEKAAKMLTVAQEADSQRADVLDKLNAASKHFGDAVTAAEAARSEIERSIQENLSASDAQKKAWDVAKNSLSAATYRVEQADALRLLAHVHASHAASLEVRLKLQALLTSAMQGSGIELPESLSDSQLQGSYEQALKEADDAYRSADEILENVMSAGQTTAAEKSAASTATISRIYGLYRWASVSMDMGASDQAKQHMDLARSIVTDMAVNGERIPTLPPELAAIAAEAKPPPEPAAPAESPEAPEGEPPAAPGAEAMPGETPEVEQPAADQPSTETPAETPSETPADQPPADPPPDQPPAEPGAGGEPG
ncbi:MAG TPA: hypothetical protein PLD59_10210 [Tepidisphaeraceae bacterium]|nr:hypothetical protein [Tepidisphaeraceae bacterium]